MSDDSKTRVLLGHVSGAHGLKGQVLIVTHTVVPENIAAYGPLTDEHGSRPLDLQVESVTARGVIARINGVTDRTAAEGLRGRQLYVDRSRLSPVEDHEFYVADLVGLDAFDLEGGMQRGSIVAVHNFGAGDVLEIRLTASGETELVPFTKAFVPEVDLAAKRVVVVALPDEGEPEEP